MSDPNTTMTITNCYHLCENGDGVYVNNSGTLRLVGSILSGGNSAIHVGTDGSSVVSASSVLINRTIGGGYTTDIKIESAAANVHFTGTASYDRIDNAAGGSLYAMFQNRNPTEEGACVLGELSVGANGSGLLPMISYGKDAYLSGLVTGGGVTRNASPSRILNVAGGSGYVNNGVDPLPVSWSGTTVTIPANATEYVYVTGAGVVTHNPVRPAYATNIVLAQAVSSTTDIVLLTQDEIQISHSLSKIQIFFEDLIGPLSMSGGIVTASATPLKLDITSGEFAVGLSERAITGGSNVAFYYVANDGAGGWTYTPATTIDTTHLDLGSGPVVYPGADHWKKDALYIIRNEGETVYYCVYGQVAYADQAAAENGAFPVVPDILDHYGMRAAGIVSHKEDAGITSVLDVRPMLGQNAPVTGAVAADHDLLLNLLHDVHTQYLTAARADAWLLTKVGNTVNLVDNGNNHDHNGGDGAQIDHTKLANIGTRTHLELESDINNHIADTANPHATTKAQVNLGSVTNDAQLKRAASDFSSFSVKSSPTNSDVLLIEDAAAAGAKKYCTLGNLPYPVPVFGQNYQSAAEEVRTTYNAGVTFQNKISLVTAAHTGTYRIAWTAVVDGSVTNRDIEAQLYNITDAGLVGVVRIMRPNSSSERLSVGGFSEIVFTGASKTFSLQYRTTNTASTVGIANARIEIWRVS